jgi:hypothetical protein
MKMWVYFEGEATSKSLEKMSSTAFSSKRLGSRFSLLPKKVDQRMFCVEPRRCTSSDFSGVSIVELRRCATFDRNAAHRLLWLVGLALFHCQ